MSCSAKYPVNKGDLALSQEPDVRVCGKQQNAPLVISVQQMTLVSFRVVAQSLAMTTSANCLGIC